MIYRGLVNRRKRDTQVPKDLRRSTVLGSWDHDDHSDDFYDMILVVPIHLQDGGDAEQRSEDFEVHPYLHQCAVRYCP